MDTNLQDRPKHVTIPELREPRFEAHIKESDLKNLPNMSKSEEAILLGISLIDQKTQYCVTTLLNTNNQMRYIESEQIRMNGITDTVAMTTHIIKWGFITFAGGALVAFGAFFFEWFKSI